MNPYESYRTWKGWDADSGGGPDLTAYFQGEFSAIPLQNPGKLLEIGFGNGEFLEWATARGHSVTGFEIISELVEAGRDRGWNVHEIDIADPGFSPEPFADTFNCVVALDVLEHLTVEQSLRFLDHAAAVCLKDSFLVLRFPNGGSPFGRMTQNGDHTHRQALTLSKLNQLLVGKPWNLIRYGNAYRVKTGSIVQIFLKSMAYGARNLLEGFLGKIYYGRRIPMDPVVTVVLQRTS